MTSEAKRFHQRNVLVTGGSGFIGRQLVQYCLDKGDKVFVLTRDLKKARAILPDSKIRIVQFDYNDLDSIEKELDNLNEKIDCIYHLSANQRYLGSRDQLYRDNVMMTQLLMEWAAAHGTETFVFTSSIDSMGPNFSSAVPLTEASICKPASVYGWSKLEAEKVVKNYGTSMDLRTVSLRVGNVYGPGSGFIVPDIAVALQQGIKNPLFRYYHQVKNSLVQLCYIDDITIGIYNTAFSEFKSGDSIILSSDDPVSIGTLFGLVSKAMDYNFIPVEDNTKLQCAASVRTRYYLEKKKKVDRMTYFRLGNWFVSNAKSHDVLGFRQTVGLAEGVVKTIAWALETGLIKK